MKRTHVITLAALAALALAGCKPSTAPLYQFTECLQYTAYPMDAPSDFCEDCIALMEHYESTGDIHYASPRYRMTMLHLAAMAHQLRMVQYLLAEGADPKALMQPLDDGGKPLTPLAAALRNSTGLNPAPTDDALMTVRALLAGGAPIVQAGAESPLLCCAQSYGSYFGTETCPLSGEELAVTLIELGARGGRDEAAAFAQRAWPKALHSLLATMPEAEAAALRTDAALLLPCAERAFVHNGVFPRKHASKSVTAPDRQRGQRYDKAEKAAALACAEELLEGVDAKGASPALNALLAAQAQRVSELREKDYFSPDYLADFIVLLLIHGANPAEGQPSARELFGAHPALRAALARRGCLFKPEEATPAELPMP